VGQGLLMLWRRTSISIGAPFEEPGGGVVYRGLERWMKGALGMKRLYLKRLRGGVWGCSFTVDPGRYVNPLKPNDLYMRRKVQLTSRCCILYIYSTNIRTEYFKHDA